MLHKLVSGKFWLVGSIGRIQTRPVDDGHWYQERQKTGDNKIHVLACWVTAGLWTTAALTIFAYSDNRPGKAHDVFLSFTK
jgi:hypothetical protein